MHDTEICNRNETESIATAGSLIKATTMNCTDHASKQNQRNSKLSTQLHWHLIG